MMSIPELEILVHLQHALLPADFELPDTSRTHFGAKGSLAAGSNACCRCTRISSSGPLTILWRIFSSTVERTLWRHASGARCAISLPGYAVGTTHPTVQLGSRCPRAARAPHGSARSAQAPRVPHLRYQKHRPAPCWAHRPHAGCGRPYEPSDESVPPFMDSHPSLVETSWASRPRAVTTTCSGPRARPALPQPGAMDQGFGGVLHASRTGLGHCTPSPSHSYGCTLAPRVRFIARRTPPDTWSMAPGCGPYGLFGQASTQTMSINFRRYAGDHAANELQGMTIAGGANRRHSMSSTAIGEHDVPPPAVDDITFRRYRSWL